MIRSSSVSFLALGGLLAGILLVSVQADGQCFQTADVTASVQYPFDPPPNDISLVFDSARNLVLGLDRCFGVVYRYDGRAWANILPPPHQDLPPCTRRAAVVYDAARAVTLLLPGYLSQSGQPSIGLYAYDTQGWKALTWTGAAPPACYSALGAFDPARGRAIFLIHSDVNAPNSWQTWEWTGSGWDQGPRLDNASPDSFTFDVGRGVGFLSGEDPATGLEAVWIYTPGATAAGGSWVRLKITGDPYSAVIGATLVYDPIRDRILRCMGKDHAVLLGYENAIDVWDWALSRWNHTDYSDDLPYDARRAGAGAAYDSNRDVLVIYGGTTYEVVNGVGTMIERTDTWEQKVLDVLYVDRGNTGSQDGSAAHPYSSLRQALNAMTSCTRAISIQASTYSEAPLTITTPVRVQAPNGPVTLR